MRNFFVVLGFLIAVTLAIPVSIVSAQTPEEQCADRFGRGSTAYQVCVEQTPPESSATGAQDTNEEDEDKTGGDNCKNRILGFPVWYEYLELNEDCDIVGPTDLETNSMDWQKASGYVAIAILEILLRIGTLVAVGFVMYGGFRFITSQGDPEGAKNARNTIINAIIGLIITIASASIVAFIANRLTAPNTSTPDSGSGDTTSIVINRV